MIELNISNQCLVCLKVYEQMNYLFSEFDQGLNLNEIFCDTTTYEIKQEKGYPMFLCENCTITLINFYNLKTTYQTSLVKIRNALELFENIKINNNIEKCEICTVEPDELNDIIEDLQKKDLDFEFVSVIETVEPNNNNNNNNNNNVIDVLNEENDKFICKICSEMFLNEENLRSHLFLLHDIFEEEVPKCKQKKLKRKKNETIFVDDSFKCKICPKRFTDTNIYNDHLETHKKFICDVCGLGFIKKAYLKDHREVHVEERKYICNYCNKTFRRRTVFIKHKKIHTHPRQCICDICGKAFNDNGTLKTHVLLKHTNEKRFQCTLCGIKFPLKSTMLKHVKRHGKRDKIFNCDQCTYSYKDKSSLDRHKLLKHCENEEDYKNKFCVCGKRYSNVRYLENHKKTCSEITLQTKTQDKKSEYIL